MIRRLLVGLVLLALSGCGGARFQAVNNQLRATAVYGSFQTDFSYSQAGDVVTISFDTVPNRGVFLSLDVPEGKSVGGDEWAGDQGTLHLLARSFGITQLGIVPTESYDGQTVTATLQLQDISRIASTPPTGPKNNIFDLSVVPAGAGQVRLTWTEVNVGDYNFDGQVNIADLTPLGANLNEVVRGGSEERLWWIDGDRNRQINIADLTPLGAALGLEVGGFIVKRNGVRIGNVEGPFTIDAALGQSRQPNLPRLHTFIADGSTSDNWLVQTVDRVGVVGSDNNGGQSAPDVTLRVDVSGLELFGVNKNTSQLGLDAGESFLRIVFPVDDIDGIELPGLGERNYLAGGGAGIDNLPRGVPLCADIIYVPAADLATGVTRSASASHAGYPQDYYVYTRVPFILPEGGSTLLIDAQIELAPNPGQGGYFVNLTAQHTMNGQTTTRRSRLNYATGALHVDSDGDGSFDDEPGLRDSWRTNVSDALRERYAKQSAYASRSESIVSGTVTAIDPAAGTLTLGSAREQVLGDADWTNVASPAVVYFSELTGFGQRIIGAGESDIDFADLAAGDSVEVAVTRLSDIAQSPAIWRLADNVTRVLGEASPPADMVYAVPELQLAYPGQPVRVTVYTTPTASALKSLHSLQITYPASCRYQPGSFNAGAPGGAPWEPDGIWSDVGATAFDIPGSDFAEFIEEGRRALRVQIRPLNGSAVNGASGELFSFVLIAGGDCDLAFMRGSGLQPLTAYADGAQTPHFWASDDNAGQPGIRVLGERPVLSILSPPPVGNGSAGSPFQITAPATYQLALFSGGVDVTTAPGAAFNLTPPSGGSVDSGGALHIAADFEGLLTVSASYNNLPNTSASTLYFNSGPPEFTALVDRSATFANGGVDAGTFSTVMTDLGDRVEVRVLGSGLVDLRALHLSLPFDPAQYAYAGYSGLDLLEAVDARQLVIPAAGGPAPVLSGGDATLRFGLALVQPSKFSGGGSLVTLHFDRVPPAAPGSYAPLEFVPPTGLLNSGNCFKYSATELRWEYYNSGDFDQDGTVTYRDFNTLALHFGTPPQGPDYPNHSLLDLLDVNNDQQLDSADAAAAESRLDSRVESYNLYGGDLNEYSNDIGALVASVPFSAIQGDGSGRRHFAYDISGLSHEKYWVRPVASGIEGQKSSPSP